jgi:hypothetical protein
MYVRNIFAPKLYLFSNYKYYHVWKVGTVYIYSIHAPGVYVDISGLTSYGGG